MPRTIQSSVRSPLLFKTRPLVLDDVVRTNHFRLIRRGPKRFVIQEEVWGGWETVKRLDCGYPTAQKKFDQLVITQRLLR